MTDAWIAGDDLAATAVIEAKVAELSVQYNEFTGRRVAIYLENNPDIVLRSAPLPAGPWTKSTIIANADDYPQVYGGFIHPWSRDGSIYFALSELKTYTTYFMRVNKRPDGSVAQPNLLADPNSER